MEKSVFRVSLDIHRQTTQTHLEVKKGDTARRIIVALSDGGLPYTIAEGCYAVFMGQKPDGSVLYNDCTIENGQIIYDFTQQTASTAGRMLCELRLYGDDDNLITSPRIAIIVSGAVYGDSEVESTSEFTALSKLMTELEQLKDSNEPFEIEVDTDETGAFVADKGIDDIQTAEELGQSCVCHWDGYDLPLVLVENAVAYFATVVDGTEHRVEISAEGVVAVRQELGASRETFEVTATIPEGQHLPCSLTPDKTSQEVADAYYSGKECVFILDGFKPDMRVRLPVTEIATDGSSYAISFSATIELATLYVVMIKSGTALYANLLSSYSRIYIYPDANSGVYTAGGYTGLLEKTGRTNADVRCDVLIDKQVYALRYVGKKWNTSTAVYKFFFSGVADVDGSAKAIFAAFEETGTETLSISVWQTPLGGEGGLFAVNVTCDDTGSYTADKTYAEVLAIHEAGIRPIQCRIIIGEVNYVLPLCGTMDGMLVYGGSAGVMSVIVMQGEASVAVHTATLATAEDIDAINTLIGGEG